MTREEAIRILDPETTGEALAEIEYYNGFSGKTAAVQAVSDACVLAVAALREQEKRRWIPVADRLPDVGSRVIACGEKGGVFVVKSDGIKTGFGRMDGASKYRSFTHWMPLPEPPKGD